MSDTGAGVPGRPAADAPPDPRGTDGPPDPRGTDAPPDPRGTDAPPDPRGTDAPPDPHAADAPDLRYAAYARERLAAMPPPADAEAFALAYHLLQLAYLLVTDLETRIHRPRGWTLPGFRLMFKLWLLGPTQPVRLAEISAMSRSAVTNAVNTLVRAGLAERRPVPGDARAVVVALTPAGETAVREAFAEQTGREREWFAVLGPAEREQLTGLLVRILRARPPLTTEGPGR